jgi:hypothetical protein
MDNKKLGIILMIIGVLLIIFIFSIQIMQNNITQKIVEEKGTCFLEDGTCLHKENGFLFIFGYIISSIIIALGIYLVWFEKSQKEIMSTLKKQKETQNSDEKFEILLKGLNEDEKKIIIAVKEQDGITQQTLRLRTDLHKSKLSILLDGLEKKDLIKRIEKGKTKQVFLKINL